MLYFRQLMPGRDIAIPGGEDEEQELLYHVAATMKNFCYLVGDSVARECFVVDGCWDVKGIQEVARKDGMKIVGAIATHYHIDHIGGFLPKPWSQWIKTRIPGLKELSETADTPDGHSVCYIHEVELSGATKMTGLGEEKFSCLRDGSKLSLSGGKIDLTFIHTPGHSHGSLCILVESKYENTADSRATNESSFLLSGDTIFPGSCGRIDLPESDVLAMYDSLQTKLAALPDNLRIYPGHAYGKEYSTIGQEKKTGLLTPISKERWLSKFKMAPAKPNL